MENLGTDTSTVRDPSDHGRRVSAVSLKGSVFTLPILKILLVDIDAIAQELRAHLATAPGFFKNSPVVLDLQVVSGQSVDFERLKQKLDEQGLVPVAVQNASTNQQKAAKRSQLGVLPAKDSTATKPAEKVIPELEQAVVEEINDSYAGDLDGQTMVIHQPIRSGQKVYARGGDLIQLAAVNAGAEIMADGNIHIYAPLRGRALAGVTGNENARIFCHSFAAELVAVAGNYRTFEDTVPDEIRKKSVQIYLQQDQLIVKAIS